MNDDQFDFMQYPDFFGDLSTLADELEETDDFPHDDEIECPFLPLRDMVLYPQMVMPLFIGRDRSLAAVQAATNNHERLIVAAQKDAEQGDPEADDIFKLGTETIINRYLKMPDGTHSALVQGRRRVEILEFLQMEPYIRVRAKVVPDLEYEEDEVQPRMRAALNYFDQVVNLSRRIPDDAYAFAINIDEPGWLADFIASTLELPVQVRQDILTTLNVAERLQKVSIFLAKELDVLQIEDKIHMRVQEEIDKTQREHFLREQMRAIQGELGEGDLFTQEVEEVREALVRKRLPDVVRAKAEKELSRLGSMPPMAPEVGVIRTYLDWILELPWVESSEETLDVQKAAKILDADHFGLDRVKDRILEHIAARQDRKSVV